MPDRVCVDFTFFFFFFFLFFSFVLSLSLLYSKHTNTLPHLRHPAHLPPRSLAINSAFTLHMQRAMKLHKFDTH